MPAPADGPLDLYAQGRLSLPLAAMRAVLEAADDAELARALDRARDRWGETVIAPLAARLDPSAVARVRETAAAVDHDARDADPAAVLARLAQGFDRAAAVSPEAGAALYSLGDPELLAQATAEVTGWLRAEGLFRPGMRVLEVGCGAGRFLRALGPEADAVVGVELSPAMAAEGARRLADLPGVAVVRGSGADLAFVRAASVDLVLYADSFPYIVQAGGGLPAAMLAESARVLRPGGRVAVLNWSYRGDADADARERAELSRRAGLAEQPVAPPRFASWDAQAFVFERAPDAALLDRIAHAPQVTERVVVVCAHPDDETVSLGGRLSAFADLTLVHVTDGAPRDMGDAAREGFATREAYAQARAAELDAALLALSPDRTPARRVALAVMDKQAVQALGAVVQALTPLLRGAAAVVTHSYEGGHPDHDACALAVALACRRLEREGAHAPVRIEFASYHEAEGALRFGAFLPAAVAERTVRLGPEALARKREAVGRHRSQLAVIGGFPPEVERYRLAPDYDFTVPPGPALYDRWGWALTSVRWRELAARWAEEASGGG